MPTRLLLPIALAQGLWVRRTVPRLPPATGRRGDFGVGADGADSTAIRERIAPVAPAADVYIVSAGVNDAVRGVSAAKFAANLAGLAMTLRRKSPHAALVFAGIPPLGAVLGARAARLQAAARVAAPEMRAICFDFPVDWPPGGFARDGFHPAEDACDVWAGWLLEAWLSRKSRPASPDCESALPPA